MFLSNLNTYSFIFKAMHTRHANYFLFVSKAQTIVPSITKGMDWLPNNDRKVIDASHTRGFTWITNIFDHLEPS